MKSLASLASYLILVSASSCERAKRRCLLAAQAQPPQAPTAESQVKAVLVEARKLVDEGKPRDAIAKLEALDTVAARSRPLLGVAYYHADDHQRAIEHLVPVSAGQLPTGSIERREAVQVLGLCYFVTGRYPEAVPLLEATRVWAPDNAELGYILGHAYIQTRQPDRAREHDRPHVPAAADSAAAHVLAAQMMIRLEFEPQAEAELKRAIEKDPKLPHAPTPPRPDRAVPRPSGRSDGAHRARDGAEPG